MADPNSLDGVFESWKGICWICDKRVKRTVASRDHIIPKSHGGPNHAANYALAHKICNERRGNDTHLPSVTEALRILNICQNDICGRCGIEKQNCGMILLVQKGTSRWILTAVCLMCKLMDQTASDEERFSSIPFQKKRIERVSMDDMSVVDTLTPAQLEEGDYVLFRAGKKEHMGVVSSLPTDNGTFFSVEIHDDERDEKVVYNLSVDAEISLLMYTQMAV